MAGETIAMEKNRTNPCLYNVKCTYLIRIYGCTCMNMQYCVCVGGKFWHMVVTIIGDLEVGLLRDKQLE